MLMVSDCDAGHCHKWSFEFGLFYSSHVSWQCLYFDCVDKSHILYSEKKTYYKGASGGRERERVASLLSICSIPFAKKNAPDTFLTFLCSSVTFFPSLIPLTKNKPDIVSAPVILSRWRCYVLARRFYREGFNCTLPALPDQVSAVPLSESPSGPAAWQSIHD